MNGLRILLALAALHLAPVSALEDEVPTCDKTVCASATEKLVLSCVGSGEKIVEVVFANFGLPGGGLPEQRWRGLGIRTLFQRYRWM